MFMYAENVSRSVGEGGDAFAAAEVSGCIAPDTNTPPLCLLVGQAGIEPAPLPIGRSSDWAVPYNRRTVALPAGGLSLLSAGASHYEVAQTFNPRW